MRVAIDGFGPDGRALLRQLQGRPGLEVVAIRDEADPAAVALLARRDSVRGAFPGPCELEDGRLVTAAGAARLLPAREAAAADWAALGVEAVVLAEPAGPFRARAAAHLAAGARLVLLAGGACREAAPVFIRGAGDPAGPPQGVLSAGSGEANCLAILALALDRAFGLAGALATFTGPAGPDQCVEDGAHGDPRRGRAAGLSLAPVASAAAREVARAVPGLAAGLAALEMRAPVAAGTALDLAAVLLADAGPAAVNEAMRSAAADPALEGLLAVAEDPLVSVDVLGSTLSCLFDPGCTRAAGGRSVGVVAWCDARWVAAARACDLLERLAAQA